MDGYSISFEYPWLLLPLVLIPVLWLFSYRRLASLGSGRRTAALLLRSAVLLCLILALAGLQWVQIGNKVSVIYVLDVSESIPRQKRELMLDLAIQSVRQHRSDARGDRAGLVVFAREAAIEFPPYDDELPAVRGLESYLGRTDATHIEAALKLAQASFPEDSANRLVLISDGIETLGRASLAAQALSQSGIGIDVVPIDLQTSSEVLVEKIDLPPNIRQGQPFQAKVVIGRYQFDRDQPVPGRLRVLRSIGSSQQVVVDDAITLDKEINVFSITDTIPQAASYTYSAEFVPDHSDDDALQQNNRADAFTYVRGKGRVLVITQRRAADEYARLMDALRRAELEVDWMSNDQLFTSLVELQAYDCVVLAGVPRSSGDRIEEIAGFSDAQAEMLVTNTQQFGSGLIMIGGPEGLGAGGWANSPIEAAMPVDFQVKNAKIDAVGALAMIMHASEIGRGNYWQKRIAEEALRMLGPMDYCGVLQYSQLGDVWLWGDQSGILRVGPNRNAMLQRIRNLMPQDMPDFQPSMQMALTSLQAVPAAIKHTIIISDGDPAPPTNALLNQYATAQIKISTVAVGAHGPAGHQTLQNIATRTGGNYYAANNPGALPKILQREAARVAKPLIREPEGGFQPQVSYPHESLTGLPRDLPRTDGYVLTTVKDSGLVEVSLRANDPEVEAENQTILATWTYGLGRAAVFTSDAGWRWTSGWTDWEAYDQFWSQLVRWAMRPSQTDANFSVATSLSGDRVEVIVNALDKEDKFLNFLDMQAVAVGPDLKPIPLIMKQSAPGRYVGSFEADQSGGYLVNIMPAATAAPLTVGASVPYSDEYRVRRTNYPLLEQLAGLRPPGGEPGILAPPLEATNFDEQLQRNSYRGGLPRARSPHDLWPWCLMLAAICLFGDIFVRRVALDYAYPWRWVIDRIFGQSITEADRQRQASLERLRSRKSEVAQHADQTRSQTRFEAAADSTATRALEIDDQDRPQSSGSPPAATPQLAATDEEEGYTARLLAAKKAAQDKRDDRSQ